MAHCKSCGRVNATERIVPAYEAVGLGAPFKVILKCAVRVEVCPNCGQTLSTHIPDMEGLFHAVVFARALEPRALSGEEIRFMRKAMGWKAKELAKHLGISAEHLSRCEASVKCMQQPTEKLFRLYALLKTPDKSALDEVGKSELFELIQIKSVWDTTKILEFHFVRKGIADQPAANTDERWRRGGTKSVAA